MSDAHELLQKDCSSGITVKVLKKAILCARQLWETYQTPALLDLWQAVFFSPHWQGLSFGTIFILIKKKKFEGSVMGSDVIFKQEFHGKFLFSKRIRCGAFTWGILLQLLSVVSRQQLHKEYIKQGRRVVGECRKSCRGKDINVLSKAHYIHVRNYQIINFKYKQAMILIMKMCWTKLSITESSVGNAHSEILCSWKEIWHHHLFRKVDGCGNHAIKRKTDLKFERQGKTGLPYMRILIHT